MVQNFIEEYPFTTPRVGQTPVFPAYVEDIVLAADALTLVPLPAGAKFVLFSFSGDFRVKLGTATTTIALPLASSSNGTGAELNPAARRIPDLLDDGLTTPTHIALRAPLACSGSLSFFK